MTRRITACPSPNGTNFERLYLIRRSGPVGALDAAMKKVGDKMKMMGDEDAPDLGQLRVALEEILAKSLSETELEEARALLDQHLGSAGEYDRQLDGEENDEHEDDEEDLGNQGDDLDMPRNAREHGQGGRLAELEGRDRKRRMARDRRREMAADEAFAKAERSFNQMFPMAARIRNF